MITSSDAVGRLLGLSSLSPTLGTVMEDLLTYGEGLEVAERDLLVSEVGQQPQSLPDQVIAVVRDENVYRYFDPVVTQLARGDRLIVVRPAQGAALGTAARHPRRGDRLRRRLSQAEPGPDVRTRPARPEWRGAFPGTGGPGRTPASTRRAQRPQPQSMGAEVGCHHPSE